MIRAPNLVTMQHKKKHKAKILLVDDRPENLLAMKRLLSDVRAEVLTADSGNEALGLALEHEFALILLDVQMPDMDGFETAELLRLDKTHRAIPIIFVTAISKEEYHVFKGYESGAIDYLCKPIQPKILLSKVDFFLEMYFQKESLAQLYRQNQLLLNSTAEGIVGIDSTGVITYANPAACQRLNMRKNQLVGQHLHIIMYPTNGGTPYPAWEDSAIYKMIIARTTVREDDVIFWQPATGESFPVEYTCSAFQEDNDRFQGGVLIFQDISEKKKFEKRFYELAKFDHLTGLSNRTSFMEFLKRAIEQSKRQQRKLAVLFIDLDNFKQVNDTKGHEIGDLLVKSVAQRLKASTRVEDMLARLGGDDFALVCLDIGSEEDAARIASHILATLAVDHEVAGYTLSVRCSIGIVVYPGGGDTANALIRSADIAMYAAKEKGRNRYCYYSRKMQEQIHSRLQMEEDLRNCVGLDELQLLYQPQVNCNNSTLSGMEALIRWRKDEDNVISPADFIPLAEEKGMIVDIGKWALETACVNAVSFAGPGGKGPLMAVNVSMRQLQEFTFVEAVEQALIRSGLAPSRLEIEITENMLMVQPEKVIALLRRIHDLGVRIAIDDFGIGYSSMNYLSRLPLDVLKIDLSFVKNIGINKSDEIIVKSIIDLAHNLNLYVIAEGVETREQVDFLKRQKCDLLQGYYFGKPQELVALRDAFDR